MRLPIIVTPRSQRDAIVGWHVDATGGRELAVSVRAIAEKGRATRAACAQIATSIGVPKRAVTCVRGETSRHKQIEIDCTQEAFDAWLARI